MKPFLLRFATCLLLVNPVLSFADVLTYPSARRSDTVDVLHGVNVADPYRWMEDIDSPETRAWVEAEAKTTSDYLSKLPRRTALLDRLKKTSGLRQAGSSPKTCGKTFLQPEDRFAESVGALLEK